MKNDPKMSFSGARLRGTMLQDEIQMKEIGIPHVNLSPLIETQDDVTLVLDNLPDLKIVGLQGITGDYDGVAEKICVAWIVDEVRLRGSKHALNLVCFLWHAQAGKVGLYHARMLSGDADRFVNCPQMGINLLTAAADEG